MTKKQRVSSASDALTASAHRVARLSADLLRAEANVETIKKVLYHAHNIYSCDEANYNRAKASL